MKTFYIIQGILIKGITMAQPLKPIGSYTTSTYQSFDGSNFTLTGLEEKFKGEKGYVSTFIGGATNFKDDAMLVLDLKGGRNYDDKGIFNQNLRVRTKLGKKSESVQLRYSPLSIDYPVSKNTSLYLNPHYSGQMDFRNDKWKNSIGAFGGVTQKLNDKTSLSVEVQRYNLQDIKDNSAKNWSLNAILSYKF